MNNRGAFFFSACLLTGCATDPGDFTPEPDGGSITLDAGMRGDGAITVLDAGRRDSAVPEVDAGPPAWWGEPIDESEAPLDAVVDIGVQDAKGGYLLLEKRRIKSGENKIMATVAGEPARAGIDPLNKLIDRDTGDNTVEVERP